MVEWTSRKLWVALIGMAMSTWLMATGSIGDTAWVSVMCACVLGYPAANVAQKALAP